MNKERRELALRQIQDKRQNDVEKYAAGGAAKVRKKVCNAAGKPLKQNSKKVK
jgi:hypothetical protein